MDLSAKSIQPGDDMDDDEHLHSIQLRITHLKGPYSSIEILRGLKQYVSSEDISGIAPLKASNCWCVTVTSNAAVKKPADQGHFAFESLSGIMAPFGSLEIRGRLLWLPLQTSNAKIHDYLSQFGTVIDVWREKFADGERKGLWNGTRSFRLNPNPDVNMESLPHLCTVAEHGAVMTILGRSPRCFRCNSAAHVSRVCDKKAKKPMAPIGTERNEEIDEMPVLPATLPTEEKSKPPILGPVLPAKPDVAAPAAEAMLDPPGTPLTRPPAPVRLAKVHTEPLKTSPAKRKPRSRTPPAKLAYRGNSVPSDSEEEDPDLTRCQILADRVLDLVPKSQLNWAENFLSVFTDQSRTKLAKMKGKFSTETMSALRLWCDCQENRRLDGFRAVRG